MKLSRDWRLYVGGGALVGLVVWLRARAGAADPPGSAPALAVPTGPERWVELDGPDVFMFTGDRYRGCVDVPGLVPNSLVRSGILKQAPGLGFRDVVVLDAPPAGWPKATTPGGDCDLFVEAVWAGADGVKLARPSQVTGAWRLARA